MEHSSANIKLLEDISAVYHQNNLTHRLAGSNRWVLRNTTQCSEACGGGYMTSQVVCVSLYTLQTIADQDQDKSVIGELFKGHESSNKKILEGGIQNQTEYGNGVKEVRTRIKRKTNQVELIDFGNYETFERQIKLGKPFDGIKSTSEPDAIMVDVDRLKSNFQKQTYNPDSIDDNEVYFPNDVLNDEFMLFGNGTRTRNGDGRDGGTRINIPGGGGQSNSDAETLMCDPGKRPPHKWVCNAMPCAAGV